MLLGSALSAMVWAAIPAFFKAYWNTNETLFTLMMNYVAMQVITYCIISGRIQRDPTPWEPSTPPQRGEELMVPTELDPFGFSQKMMQYVMTCMAT